MSIRVPQNKPRFKKIIKHAALETLIFALIAWFLLGLSLSFLMISIFLIANIIFAYHKGSTFFVCALNGINASIQNNQYPGAKYDQECRQRKAVLRNNENVQQPSATFPIQQKPNIDPSQKSAVNAGDANPNPDGSPESHLPPFNPDYLADIEGGKSPASNQLFI
jgi:hypothetical protein